MKNDASSTKRVLVVRKDSVLAAGLHYLLRARPELEVAAIGEAGWPELLGAIHAFAPDLVVLPCVELPQARTEGMGVCGEGAAPRLVCVSSDCSHAYVYTLSRVPLTVVDDLLALIPAVHAPDGEPV